MYSKFLLFPKAVTLAKIMHNNEIKAQAVIK